MTIALREPDIVIANREDWLIRAVELMTPWITELGHEMPPVRVSVGWPGGRAKKAVTIGQCWPTGSTADGIAQIFLTPARGEEMTVDVLGTLLHEMVHAVDDCKSGHAKGFITIAKALGFIPKWTQSGCRSAELTERLSDLILVLGGFPHGAIVVGSKAGVDAPKPQENRQLKVECPACGYIVRTTRKWMELGLPTCPCGVDMEASC